MTGPTDKNYWVASTPGRFTYVMSHSISLLCHALNILAISTLKTESWRSVVLTALTLDVATRGLYYSLSTHINQESGCDVPMKVRVDSPRHKGDTKVTTLNSSKKR